MTKSFIYIFFLVSVFACHMHQTLAQQNWWETLPDGNPTIASSRRQSEANSATTQSPPSSSTPACGCLPTREYNPVCGDNRVTYDNLGSLECAQSCGTSK